MKKGAFVKASNNLFVIVIVIAFYSLSAVSNAIYAASDHMISYKNQRGSIMALNFHPGKEVNEGTLDGTVKLAMGDPKKDTEIAFPLSGYYSGNAMAITISFLRSKQVTAMIGHFLDNKRTIQTLSLDALQTKNSHMEDWNSNIIRAGYYTRL